MRRKTKKSVAAGIAIALSGLALRAEQRPARPLRYRIEVAGSSVRWELPASFRPILGIVPLFHGFVEADPLSSGAWDVRCRIVVPAASMRTGSQLRDRTLREKVLETDRFPEIVFELRRFTGDLSRFRPGETFSVEVAGDLTVHGKTAPVQLPVDVSVFPGAVVLRGSFPVHWKSYGLQDPSFPVVARVNEPMQVDFRLRAVPSE
ncbi:MAG TPA: YceI family protein [Thermoanaerobaculia bacterium]